MMEGCKVIHRMLVMVISHSEILRAAVQLAVSMPIDKPHISVQSQTSRTKTLPTAASTETTSIRAPAARSNQCTLYRTTTAARTSSRLFRRRTTPQPTKAIRCQGWHRMAPFSCRIKSQLATT